MWYSWYTLKFGNCWPAVWLLTLAALSLCVAPSSLSLHYYKNKILNIFKNISFKNSLSEGILTAQLTQNSKFKVELDSQTSVKVLTLFQCSLTCFSGFYMICNISGTFSFLFEQKLKLQHYRLEYCSLHLLCSGQLKSCFTIRI